MQNKSPLRITAKETQRRRSDSIKLRREFVGSPRGKKKIRQGAKVRPEEEAELAKAGQTGRERAKSDDSAAE